MVDQRRGGPLYFLLGRRSFAGRNANCSRRAIRDSRTVDRRNDPCDGLCSGLLVWRTAASGMVAFVFPTMPHARVFAWRADRAALPHRPGFATRAVDRIRRSLLDRCLVYGLFFVSEFPSVLWLRSGRRCLDVLF